MFCYIKAVKHYFSKDTHYNYIGYHLKKKNEVHLTRRENEMNESQNVEIELIMYFVKRQFK